MYNCNVAHIILLLDGAWIRRKLKPKEDKWLAQSLDWNQGDLTSPFKALSTLTACGSQSPRWLLMIISHQPWVDLSIPSRAHLLWDCRIVCDLQCWVIKDIMASTLSLFGITRSEGSQLLAHKTIQVALQSGPHGGQLNSPVNKQHQPSMWVNHLGSWSFSHSQAFIWHLP